MTSFENCNVLITGGSSGIGKATALMLVQSGANVYLLARDPRKLKAAAYEMALYTEPQQRVAWVQADVRNFPELEAAVSQMVQDKHPPQILINCAGIAQPGYFGDLPLEAFWQQMEINFYGTVYACQAVLPCMKTQGFGHIVNVSSLAGLIGVFGYTAYGASKFAVRGFSEVLRCELKPYGIRVSVVLPPDTDTPQLWEENKVKPRETKALSGSTKPLKPEQVAQAILQGIKKGKFLIIPGLEGKLIYRLQGWCPSLLYWYIDHMVNVTRMSMGKNPSHQS